jgi:hypothetical protein
VIKITVHESVEEALHKAFPRPAGSAKKALAKYVAVVEAMLFDALQHGQTPEQLKLNLYAVSLDQLANKGGQIGSKKIRVHKWLRDIGSGTAPMRPEAESKRGSRQEKRRERSCRTTIELIVIHSQQT